MEGYNVVKLETRAVLLPKEQWEIKIFKGTSGIHILSSISTIAGYRNWEKYKSSDLPNNLISIDDLKRFGIDIVNI
jgi:hypothetical protein